MKTFLIISALVALSATHPHKRQAPNAGYPNVGNQDANVVLQQLAQKLPFLQGVNRQGQEEFFSLITDMKTPKGQVDTSLDNWAAKYNVQSQWNTFKAQYEAQKTELITALRQFVQQLPAAFEQLVQIGENRTLNGEEMVQQSGNLLSTMTQKVGSAIQQFAKYLFGDKNTSTNPGTGGNTWGGNNNGGFPGNNNGGFPGNQNGGFPGNNNGGFSGNNNGGFPGNGAFPGGNNNNNNNNGNNGGFPGNNNGGFPGNQNGGFPGNNNGGFPGNNNGGFPGNNNNGGFPGNQNGGNPGNNNGGFSGNNNGQFGGNNGGFPGQFGGNNNNNNNQGAFGGFQIPGQQGQNNNNNVRPGQFTQNGFARF